MLVRLGFRAVFGSYNWVLVRFLCKMYERGLIKVSAASSVVCWFGLPSLLLTSREINFSPRTFSATVTASIFFGLDICGDLTVGPLSRRLT